MTKRQRIIPFKYSESASVRNKTLRLVPNFRNQRSLENQAGSARAEAPSQIEQKVATYFSTNPRRSLSTAERDLTFAWSSIQRFVRNMLHVRSYKTQIIRHLEDRNLAARTWFLNSCRESIQPDCSFLNRIIFFDKNVLQLDGKFNKDNARIWATENSHKYWE